MAEEKPFCWCCGEEKPVLKKIESDVSCARAIKNEHICADCCFECDIVELCDNPCIADEKK